MRLRLPYDRLRALGKIRVNVISPGPTDTPGLSHLFENGQHIKMTLLRTIPLGRMGSPDEVAKAVLFLASDDSSFITGIEVDVVGDKFKMTNPVQIFVTLLKLYL